MLEITEMLRELLELAFETDSEGLLQVCDAFEAADNNWQARRSLKNKVAAQEAYKTLRATYRLHFEV